MQDPHRWDHLLQTWSPGLSRLSAGAWVAVAAYLLAAGLCVRRARQLPPARRAGWLVPAGILLFLGAGRLLDLPDLFTITFRNLMVRHDWYDDRRRLQLPFIIGAALLSAGAVALIWRRSGASTRPLDLRLAWLGTILAGLLFAVRSCSLHSLDRLLGRGWGGVHLGGVFELACLLLVSAAAARREPPPPAAP